MFVKICGLTTPDAVKAAVAGGADALGFVFADSARRLSPAQALSLCRGLPDHLTRVAVMRHPSAAEWAQVRNVFAPDWLQTEARDFESLELGEGCEPLPVFRNAPALPDSVWPEHILFEGLVSGGGLRADWEAAARVAIQTRLILAGGLDCDSVGSAIQAVRPWGVDVSSGVEQALGVKDPEKIKQFIARVRAAER